MEDTTQEKKQGVRLLTDMGSIHDLDYLSAEEQQEAVYKKYKSAKDHKQLIDIQFSMVDRNGSMYMYEHDIKVCLPEKYSIRMIGGGYNFHSTLLSRRYRLEVASIDRENGIVTLCQNNLDVIRKNQIEEQLNDAVENGIGICVPASIVAVRGQNNEILLIDIANLGIAGCVRLAEWSQSFTKSFSYACNIGDKVDVVVTGIAKWRSGDIYDCSRRLAIDSNPWSGIETKLPKNTTVRVLCIDCGDRNFFGKIEGLPDLNCYCEYPDDSRIRIAPGIEYTGYVSKVSEEKRLLRIRISGFAKED